MYNARRIPVNSLNIDFLPPPNTWFDPFYSGLAAQNVMPEYKGGIEETGLRALRDFVDARGTVVTLGRSTQLAIEKFAAILTSAAYLPPFTK